VRNLFFTSAGNLKSGRGLPCPFILSAKAMKNGAGQAQPLPDGLVTAPPSDWQSFLKKIDNNLQGAQRGQVPSDNMW
jgi:hypothetical protein